MKAYLSDPQLKQDFVAEIERHRKADQITKGIYGNGSGKNWKGCAVGCSIHSLNKLQGKRYSVSDHKVYETALGIPEWLARLEDTLFENLPDEKALNWPTRLANAIPVGADLEPVKWKFCAFILSENIERVLSLDSVDDLKKQVVDSIRGVVAVHENAIKTGNWDESAARSAARSAAESAAWSAAEGAWSAAESARSAARSAAWSAARSAAESAARSAARSAAWSAAEGARSAAWSAAESAAYKRYADKLIELLELS